MSGIGSKQFLLLVRSPLLKAESEFLSPLLERIVGQQGLQIARLKLGAWVSAFQFSREPCLNIRLVQKALETPRVG